MLARKMKIRFLSLLMILLGSFVWAQAEIAVSGTVSTGTVDGSVASITVSHNTPAGSNRLMLVGISFNNYSYSPVVSSVTYDSVSMGSAKGTVTHDDDAYVRIYKLVAPNTGTHDVVVTLSAALAQYCDIIVGVMTFTGVDQTTPLGSFFSASLDFHGQLFT